MGTSFRLTITGVAAFTLMSAAKVLADEPKLEQLLARIPILSSDGETAESFYVRGRVQFQPNLHVDFEATCTKPHQSALLVTIGEDDPAPVLYCARGRIFLVDYLQNVVTYHETGTPSVKIGLGAEDTLSFSLGVNSKDTGKIVVDLQPLLRGLGDDAKWNHRKGGEWRYSNISKSGNSRVIADFNIAARGYPLQRFEVRSTSDDSLMIALNEIAVDEPVPSRLSSFPARTDFPDGIIVESKEFETDQNVAWFAWIMKQFTASLLATAAIDAPELREAAEVFNEVDWKRAEQNRRRYAPQLRSLLKLGRPSTKN